MDGMGHFNGLIILFSVNNRPMFQVIFFLVGLYIIFILVYLIAFRE